MDIREIIEPDFNGCLSIHQDQAVVFEGAFGLADLPNQWPNTLDTRFATASAGKVFVAVAILQLIEEGRLRLCDPIGSLLDLDWKAIDPFITVEQLLTHTSGIPDYFDETVMADYAELWQTVPNYRIRSGRDLIPLFINKPMLYPPGEKFQYNNTGFTVLGLILEAVTGLPFDGCIQERIFDPAGMASSGYFELDRLPARCASHYIKDEKTAEYHTNIYSVDAKGSGAGGAFVTVGDIQRFWTKLLSFEFLSRDMTQRMLSVQSSGPDEDNYGFGIWLAKDRTDNSLPYFTGSDPGVSFISSYDLNARRLITIVSNFENNVWKLHGRILEAMPGLNSK